MDDTSRYYDPAPYRVERRYYLNTQFLHITHIEYPGASRSFTGTEDQAEAEAARLNRKVEARLRAEGKIR